MDIKTQDLIGPALDWAVAKCDGRGIEFDEPRDPWLTRDGISDQPLHSYTPSTDWSQAGPIIERERISISTEENGWSANICAPRYGFSLGFGPTPLIAAMRCYVASKLGDEIDVPKELLA